MAAGNAVWGIDIGQCSLKALKLRPAEDGHVEAVAFDLIEHPKILSQPDADPEELINGALEKFASRNDWQGDQFVIGVPGQQTFARFCKMPPVDQKKIPELVRFEASQQIPFDIDDVVWDYQTFATEDSPELEVGIFAMRKDLIRKHIDYFAKIGVAPTVVQTVPSALYNFCRFDRPGADESGTAVVVINVGAQNTDLVIVEPNSAWTRNIPLGGNSFTEALVRAFKLSFAKAESLKRTAATSKYARQIFQAMRPVFAELVAEIQRSIGFYSSTHRDIELNRVLALGNAFRLPGLQKYLENNLTIPGGVLRPEKFEKMVTTATINAPQFTENILTFAPAYGLALQGLGLAQINASLLPPELARIAVWRKKQWYFVAAAACLGLAAVLPWTRNFLDSQALASTQSQEAQRVTQQIINEAQNFKNEYAKVQTNTDSKEESIKKLIELQKGKSLVPRVLSLVYEAMPDVDPRLAAVTTPEQLKELTAADNPTRLPRNMRRQVLIDSLSIEYVPDINSVDLKAATPGGPGGGGGGGVGGMAPPAVAGGFGGMGGVGGLAGPGGRSAGWMPEKATKTEPGFHVHVMGRLLYGETQPQAIQFLDLEYYHNLRQLANQSDNGFYIPDDDPKTGTRNIDHPMPPVKLRSPSMMMTAAAGTEAPKIEDPLTGEDMSGDWRIEFGFKIKLGEKPKTDDKASASTDDRPGG